MGAGPTKKEFRRRILVAEDDPAIAKLLERALGTKYDVVVANDGPGAIAEATRPPYPNLLLLDVMMPGVDGIGVVHQVRLLPQLAKVPVIFLTAKNTPTDVIRGIQAGARHYISKPFGIADVLKKVESVLGS